MGAEAGVAWLAGILGCGLAPERGAAPVEAPVSTWIEAPDQVLPGGVVGERYTASVWADGGSPPYRWRAVDPLPSGLRLGRDGVFSGVPVEAGPRTFALVATDAEGREKRMLATFTAVLRPVLTRCGGHLEGSFREGVWTEAGAPDLSRLDDLAWLAVELPQDRTTRIELVFTTTGDAVAWLQRANEQLGSWDLATYAQRALKEADSPRAIPVDAGTDPSLTELSRQALLPVLLAPKTAGDWALDVVCTDGPVFQTLDKYPRLVGSEFQHDYEVYGDNAGVRIWTDDPLPPWMVWDEATGTVSGFAEELGAWAFDLHAAYPDGRERVEPAVLGTYQPQDVACGDTLAVTTEEAWEEGDQVRRYDPRGFRVFRLPLPTEAVSGVVLRAAGAGGHYLGLARPDPGWQVFFGHAEERLEEEGAARLRIDAGSYPASRHFVDTGELYFTVGRTRANQPDPFEVTVTCDETPTPDVRGLPVLAPLAPVDLTLRGIGGAPPYAWSADGLPPGLVLSAEGRVTGATGAVGRHRVTVTVTDRAGVAGTQALTWTVGEEDACLGFPTLGCGGAAAGALTAAGADGGPAARDTYCVRDVGADVGFTVYGDDGEYRVSLSDPGVERRGQLEDPTWLTWSAELGRAQVVGVPFDTFSFPNRLDYAGRPLFVSVWAEVPGTYAIEADCPLAP